MINTVDRQLIKKIAGKYQAKRVVLFGSSILPEVESRDIDLGVDGIAEKDFFRFYGELLCALSKPVDIIDLSVKSRFVDLVQQEGIPLYA
ncbi:MAG: hypothetical protein AB1585_10025 [Thermodesulfobacteriota bacterium]